MSNRRSPLEYPVTIKLVEGYLVFTVRDLQISLVEEMPADGRLTPEFMRKVQGAVGKSWIKASERLKAIQESGKPLPDPSKIRVATKELIKSKPLTAPGVAKLLKLSKDMVRRIPKSELRYRRTKGGHRRYSVGAIKAYRDKYETQDV